MEDKMKKIVMYSVAAMLIFSNAATVVAGG